MTIYVLFDKDNGPVVAHTTEQGAAEEMSKYSPGQQSFMTVTPISLVDDDDP